MAGSSRPRRAAPLLLLGIVLAFCWFGPNGLGSRGLHTWNWYHYFLGSRYFDELGYEDLYEQTLAAQYEDDGPLTAIRSVRDLHTYRPVPIDPLHPPTRSPRFTDARWRSFKADVRELVARASVRTWRRILRDRGYNATPFWDAAFRALTRRVDLGNPLHLWGIKSLDVVGALVTLFALGRVCGWSAATLAALAFALFPPTAGRFLGGTIKYDWLYVLLLVPVALRRERPGWAGALIGLATSMRVFPAVFLFGFAARAARTVRVDRQLPARELSVLAGFAAALTLGVAVGSMASGGGDRWRQFGAAIELHNAEMTYGNGRVGLKHLFTFRPGGEATPSLATRRANVAAARPAIAALQLGLLLLLFVAAGVSGELEAFVLSAGALFTLTVASHYYWSVLMLGCLIGLPPPGAPHGPRRWWAAIGPIAAFLPSAAWYVAMSSGASQYLAWIVVDAVLLALLVVAGGLAWIGRRRRGAPGPSPGLRPGRVSFVMARARARDAPD